MVRINLIPPKLILDQHLMAEFNEILMLCGYVKKNYPFICDIPEKYCLGKGHIKFFANKLLYLERRFNLIKEELKKRNYNVTKDFTFQYKDLDVSLWNNYYPTNQDYIIIKTRLKEKILLKPNYYTYYKKKLNPKECFKLMEIDENV
jgi:deoxyribonuclease (pyrimidine dimer)